MLLFGIVLEQSGYLPTFDRRVVYSPNSEHAITILHLYHENFGLVFTSPRSIYYVVDGNYQRNRDPSKKILFFGSNTDRYMRWNRYTPIYLQWESDEKLTIHAHRAPEENLLDSKDYYGQLDPCSVS